MTAAEAARLVCRRCRDEGLVPCRLPGTDHHYHGNPFVRCDASALWAHDERAKKV